MMTLEYVVADTLIFLSYEDL